MKLSFIGEVHRQTAGLFVSGFVIISVINRFNLRCKFPERLVTTMVLNLLFVFLDLRFHLMQRLIECRLCLFTVIDMRDKIMLMLCINKHFAANTITCKIVRDMDRRHACEVRQQFLGLVFCVSDQSIGDAAMLTCDFDLHERFLHHVADSLLSFNWHSFNRVSLTVINHRSPRNPKRRL